MKPFRYFGTTPWTGDRQTARPLPTQETTTETNADIIRAWNGTGIHDPRVQATQNHTALVGVATGIGCP